MRGVCTGAGGDEFLDARLWRCDLHKEARVAATRKMLLHLRYIEKKEALIGGGDPHRFLLSDAVMIKDTHLELADLNVLANTVPLVMNGT